MGDWKRVNAIGGRMTAEQVADLIRDDAWRASSQRLDDALGWDRGAPKRFAPWSRSPDASSEPSRSSEL